MAVKVKQHKGKRVTQSEKPFLSILRLLIIPSVMTRLAAHKACENFSDTLNRVADKGERIILHRRGKNVAALVPVEDLALLEELEDRLDAEDFRTAKAEWERDGRKTIPLEEVVRDLGIKV